jgi:MFS superfamily sulfate permease-like transporter
MFLLLLGGAAVALVRDPGLAARIAQAGMHLRLPAFAPAQMSWHELVVGTLFLALPQLPLTLGNAIIAITEENNRLFPDRPVSEKKVAISTGVMNLLGPLIGGVPMCHGAGGMAGHVRFGARTGGSLIILGVLVLLVALLFSDSALLIFQLFPPPVLGVILFMTGAQLALGAQGESLGGMDGKSERFVVLVTAGAALWNVGLACVLGVAAYHLIRRGWLKI